MARMVNCVKLGREAEGLDFPPVPGDLGKRLWENVSKEAWAGWLKHQTMLVNENRLNLADTRAAQIPADADGKTLLRRGRRRRVGLRPAERLTGPPPDKDARNPNVAHGREDDVSTAAAGADAPP